MVMHRRWQHGELLLHFEQWYQENSSKFKKSTSGKDNSRPGENEKYIKQW